MQADILMNRTDGKYEMYKSERRSHQPKQKLNPLKIVLKI